MPSWLEGRSFAVTVAILFVIVLLRAQATYWAGRSVGNGIRRTAAGRRMNGPRTQRAIASLHRWGPPLITVSFLTVGFQTVVNAAAGLTRMRWGRYTAAMLPGCVLWALLYGTVGFAAFTALFTLTGPWQWAALGAILALAVAGVAIRRHARRRLAAADRAAGPIEGQHAAAEPAA